MGGSLKASDSLETVAFAVGDALRRHGVAAVMTGGACATWFSGGEYQSSDVDFVTQGDPQQRVVDEALGELGFRRDRDRYVHPHLPYLVEFPAGPLAIGADHDIRPVQITAGGIRIRSLSATDACRDRLSAFYHWNDRQSLDVALAIARRHRLDLRKIRSWSESEGMSEKYERFRSALRQRRADRRRAKNR
jgi:hypothetical protein